MDGITDSTDMSLSKLREMVEDRKADTDSEGEQHKAKGNSVGRK